MGPENSTNMLFFTVVKVMAVYVLFIALSPGLPDITGSVVEDVQVEKTLNGIHGYLTMVKNHPSDYVLVTGSYAKEYEINYAEKISRHFGLRAVDEDDIETSSKLILIGNPNTNLLLDKFLKEPYFKNKAMISVAGDNLLIVIGDEGQTDKLADTVIEFNENRYKLSPDKVTFDFDGIKAYIIVAFVILVLLILLYLEKSREVNVSKAKELKEEYKLEALENYIRRYREEGHPEGQIRKWLIKYGYDAELIDIAIDGLKEK